MYGIFEITGDGRKVRAFGGVDFVSVAVALSNAAPVAYYDMDDENDAADFITMRGEVYAIERVAS